jgi:transposase
MKHYIGLDVSMKETSICIVSEKGKIVYESIEITDPIFLAQHILRQNLVIEKIGIESGSMSHWLITGLQKTGLPAICIDARQMSKVLSVKVNKTDKNDAQGIAEAMRCGYYREVSLKAQKNLEAGTLLAARKMLVHSKVDLKNGIRGLLKTYGVCISISKKKNFIEKVREVIANLALHVQTSIEALITAIKTIEVEIKTLEKSIQEITENDEDVELLMTVPGVGVITALSFKISIDDPTRFKDSRQVGAYLGLTPKQYSSGETNKQGSISKCGNTVMRSLLVEAGMVMLTRTKSSCKPKEWARKLARKKGTKKAAVALGRKLAVIMHRMLITRKAFQFGTQEAKSEVKKKEVVKVA